MFFFGGFQGAARPQNRVFNGVQCTIAQAPHVVQLNMRYSTPTKRAFCGGSLVTENRVLTAAHCLDGYILPDLTLTDILNFILVGLLNPSILLDPTFGDPLEIYVVAGSDTLIGDPENSDITDCIMKASRTNFRIHEEYNPKTIENDIGVIELPERFTLTDCPDAKCILLPNLNFDENTEITVAGFGYTSNDQTLSENLMCGEMVIVSDRECEDVYGEEYNPSDTIYCVTARDDDYFCNGDSGSAMFTNGANELEEVCIVSFGHVDSCEGFPQGCTKASPYIPWICSGSNVDCPVLNVECLRE